MDIKKICAALCACVVCLCAVGCSKDSKDSSSATESKANVSTADNADSAKSEDSKGDESDTDSKVLNEQGELIKKTAAIFDGDYTLKTTCTEADGSKQEVVRAKKGGNIYLKVTSDIGTSGFIYVDGAGYDYDNVTGVYHKSDVKELDGVLESIVKQNLPRTYGHINSDEADDFDIEERDGAERVAAARGWHVGLRFVRRNARLEPPHGHGYRLFHWPTGAEEAGSAARQEGDKRLQLRLPCQRR